MFFSSELYVALSVMITMVLPLLPMCHAMARTSAAEMQNNAQQTGSARKTTLWSGLPATIWDGMIALHCVSIVGNTVPQGNLIFTIPTATGTGFLPRVVQCSDGSYCCDNEPACCLNHTGVVLNGNGVVVTTLPSLTSTSSSSSTSATSTSTTSSISISVVNSTSLSSATSSTSSAPVAPTTSSTSTALPKPIPYQGIVGGVVGAVAVIASIARFLIWRQRRRVIRLEAAVAAAQLPEEHKMQSYADTQVGAYAKAPVQTIRAEMDTGIPEPTEIDGIGVQNRLVELPGSHDRK